MDTASAIFGVQSIDYTALLPVLLVAGGALAVLLADLFLSAGRKPWLSWATIGVIVAALVSELALWTSRTSMPRNTFCVPGVKGAAGSVLSCSYSVDNFTL
ncbi:MAG TPA: hypothetical protein VN779_15690, partial [Actinocrinis sp.]|nr:hypothetical protein [Actinocrinis sp.]